MKLSNVRTRIERDDCIISAQFQYNGKQSSPVEIYLALNKKFYESGLLAADYTAFFPLALMLSMKVGEDLYVEGPISEKLFQNAHKIIERLVTWNVGFSEIKITSEGTHQDRMSGSKIGSFFSGGVDSFYTFLKNKESNKDKIDSFILLHGFDIRLDDEAHLNEVKRNIDSIAKDERIEVITLKTNLRELSDRVLDWGFAHGAALGAVSLLLRSGLKTVYIPSSYTYDTLFPWGSHPDLDPLWGTESLEIIHDGCDAQRLEKTKFIAKYDTALKYLRVCWNNVQGAYNCGKCPKCLRTMIDLEIAGALSKAQTFQSEIDLKVVRKANARGHGSRVFYEQSLEELRKQNRNKPLQDALAYILYEKNYNTFTQKIRDFIAILDKNYNKGRLWIFLSRRGIL